MTKENLAFMFNNYVTGFFIKKNILVSREKRAGKKIYKISDITIADENYKPVEFKNIDELFEYTIDGKKISDIMRATNELNIDNQF